MPFGSDSFWIQPWRSYLDTWPASRLLDALGINFNVSAADAEGTAQLLQDSGFKLARREIPWDAISYSNPSELRDDSKIRAALTAMHNHGLRPLILLNANSDSPGPSKQVTLETVSGAPAGAQTVMLTPASAAAVVPGKTGFNNLSWTGNPDLLITSVGLGGVATLSRPLPVALTAGAHGGTTLLYAPFGPPKLSNGQPNPAFGETLAGWLSYVGAVSREAAGIVGPEGYDLEIWNELGFGSKFLNAENYYATKSGASSADTQAQSISEAPESVSEEPPSEPEAPSEAQVPQSEAEAAQPDSETPTTGQLTREVTSTLLKETVAYVRNPANGISPAVGITNGFASQTPFPSGALAPLGLTALSKHPYAGARDFPAQYVERNIRPVDALGAPNALAGSAFTPLFLPSYQSDFPEYTLTATSTETLIRDIAPMTTNIYRFPHGRNVGPVGGSPVQKWATEYNLGSTKGVTVGADGITPATGSSAALTPADKAHFQAKVAIRSLVADVSKGLSREYFFAAAPGPFSLIGEGFSSALEATPGSYPGDALGGETMDGLRNMLARFQGPGPEGAPTQIQLRSIAQAGNHAQFAGDGSVGHPALFDRDVLAVFPFQSSPSRFVIPVYVMTRDLRTLYEPNAPSSDIYRFDLPNERFTVTLANLPETGNPPTVSAYDPLRNESTPARLVSQQGDTGVFEFAASDYPRILTIDYK